MTSLLSPKKELALERMRSSRTSMRRAMFKSTASSGQSNGMAMMMLSSLTPHVVKQAIDLVQNRHFGETLSDLLTQAQQEFKKTMGPVIDKHPFVAVLVAASAGALLVRYRQVIAGFLADHLWPQLTPALTGIVANLAGSAANSDEPPVKI